MIISHDCGSSSEHRAKCCTAHFQVAIGSSVRGAKARESGIGKTAVPPSRAKRSNAPALMNSSLEQIYSLQRTVGNRQVQQLLRSGVIQAKLTVNEPGDIYEQEADRIAERVLAVPTHSAGPQIQRMAGQ